MKLFSSLVMLPVLASAAEWSPLPSLPDKEGFAGAFAGVAGGTLIVAGGTNFPDKMPWEGGTKIWYDQILGLSGPEGTWKVLGKLPKPNGYGVSLSTADGMLVIGGGDAAAHFQEVVRLKLDGEKATAETLPPLPKPCAFMAGVEAGGSVYLAGGIEHPTDTAAMPTFWTLDLKSQEKGWKELPPCPGPARILASMAAADGVIYLFSGAALKPGPDGKPMREWLKDAWRYTSASGWQQLGDMPHVSVAAPSPLPVREGKFLLIGGDDGELVNFEPKAQHPGFPRRVLAYDPKADRWAEAGALPFSLVTTPSVEWLGKIVIAGGEARPGKRSPEVWWK